MPLVTRHARLLGVLVVGCACPEDARDTAPAGWGSTTAAFGLEADEGFGSAVAWADDVAWVGAPHVGGGRLYRVAGGGVEPVLAGEGRLGAAVAVPGTDGLVLAGDPLAGEGAGRVVAGDGAVLVEGDGAGIALAAREGLWVAARAGGWVASDGRTGTTPARPTALALSPDTGAVGAGMARGATALVVDGATWPRPEAGDEAGFAVAAGDVDGDGEPEWLVGAPGAGVVHVLGADLAEEAAIPGDGGRFGAALAVADVDGDGVDDLVVGAPMAGTAVEGEARLYLGGDLAAPAATWRGKSRDDQLGFAVAAAPGVVVLGAPGGPGRTGAVQVVSSAGSGG